ncbi:MAG TPA: hypothetical protein VMR97_07850 [Acidimicrobiales bacterium]|nr:hypothetical protein [Acidimicrobiales bacterium]
MRLNVYLPDELATTVREKLPDIKMSGVLQEALRGLLGCHHAELCCRTCAIPITRAEITTEALDAFYAELSDRLDLLVRRVGTAEGAAKVARDVARRHGIGFASWRALPRPTRGEREHQKQLAWELERAS